MSPIMFYIISFFAVLLVSSNIFVEAGNVGVYYGRVGDNLPSPTAVVNLLRSKNIDKVCLTSPNPDALNALRGSGIEVVLVIQNNMVESMNDPDFAGDWVYKNIQSFSGVRFRYISVGNEVNIPYDRESNYILPGIKNIQNALRRAGIPTPVTTTISFGLVTHSFPPSSGRFTDASRDIMQSIVRFLEDNGSPLLANIYPYFSYTGNRQQIPLDYALFTANRVVATDSGNGLQYTNLFDALMDALYAAIDKVGRPAIDAVGRSRVNGVVTESGWPSGGGNGRIAAIPNDENGNAETISNAQTYVNNLISHVSGTNGTPRRPGSSIETYIFALFNENKKTGDPIEQHFGLFYPDMRPVYPVNFR